MQTSKTLALSVAVSVALFAPTSHVEARGLDKLVKDVFRGPVTVLESGTKELHRGVESVAKEAERTTERVAKDVERTAEKVAAEAERGIENVVEGVTVGAEAAVDLAVAGVESQINAVEALANGDVDAAVRSVTIDHLRAQEDIAAEAVMESSALRLVGQVAATAYGGGAAGAAAFSGWYGYHASGGDWDAAGKSAAMTLATSSLGSGVAKIPGDPGLNWATAGRAATSGAGAAVIVGVAGGDAEARQNAFWMGAATSASADTYRAVAKTDMSGKLPTEGPVPKDGTQPITSLSKQASHAGFEVAPSDWDKRGASWFLAQENGPVMQGAGMVPGVNGGAYFHDAWMQTTSVPGTAWVVGTVAPAMVMAYTASGVPLSQQAQDDVALSQEN